MSNTQIIKIVLLCLIALTLLTASICFCFTLKYNKFFPKLYSHIRHTASEKIKIKEKEYAEEMEQRLKGNMDFKGINKNLAQIERIFTGFNIYRKTSLVAIFILKWVFIVSISVFFCWYYKNIVVFFVTGISLYLIIKQVLNYFSKQIAKKFLTQGESLINSCATLNSYGVAFPALLNEAAKSINEPLRSIIFRYYAGAKKNESEAFTWMLNMINEPTITVCFTSMRNNAQKNADYSGVFIKIRSIIKLYNEINTQKNKKIVAARNEIIIMTVFTLFFLIVAMMIFPTYFAHNALYFILAMLAVTVGCCGIFQS